MKTLFLMEKYAGANPQFGQSNSLHNFVGSLEHTGLSEIECLFFDEYQRQYGNTIDSHLIHNYRDVDLLFFTYLFYYPYNPHASTIREIRDRGTSVVCMWSDFCKIKAPEYENSATLNLIIDVPPDSNDNRYWSTFTPQDPRIYYDRGFFRDLHVSFVGCVDKPERRDYFNRLQREPGLFHLHETNLSQPHMALSPQDYASLFQRSKMSINLSKSENGRKQLKGRIFEILHCGALLLSDHNEQLEWMLTPGVDYVRFDNPDDLVDKCYYYLAHEQERLKIAASGHKKAIECFDNFTFWKTLFEKVDL